MVPRSVTMALALPMAQQLGASQSIAAAAVGLTGLIGANVVRPLLDVFGFSDPIVRGLTAAASAAGLGTAALAAHEPEALPYCALSYALCGIFGTVLTALPAVQRLVAAITG